MPEIETITCKYCKIEQARRVIGFTKRGDRIYARVIPPGIDGPQWSGARCPDCASRYWKRARHNAHTRALERRVLTVPEAYDAYRDVLPRDLLATALRFPFDVNTRASPDMRRRYTEILSTYRGTVAYTTANDPTLLLVTTPALIPCVHDSIVADVVRVLTPARWEHEAPPTVLASGTVADILPTDFED